MSNAPPSPDTDRILTLLRILLEPRTNAEERRHVADTLVRCPPESLASCLAEQRVACALRSLDNAHAAVTEDQTLAYRPGTHGRYSLGADLRILINDAFNAHMWTVAVGVGEAIAASERARLIAAARECDSDAGDEAAHGLAWTQLDPGAPLLRWKPEQRSQITAYVQHALDRVASDACMPVPFAHAVNEELACRPASRQWFDSTYAWIEAWTACTSLVTVERRDVQSAIRRMRRMLRVGVALRAASADIRIPRLLALAELAAATVVIRATGKADLIRAHRAADGDASMTARTHQKGDRDADLLVEVAIGEVLRPLSVTEVEALYKSEREALQFVAHVLSDPRLQSGLLSSAGLWQLADTEPADGNP